MPSSAPRTLAELLRTALSQTLDHASDTPADDDETELAFRSRFSGAKRRLGERPLDFSPAQLEALNAAGFPSAAERPAHVHGRVALLLERLASGLDADFPRFLHTLFIRGDNMEQCAILCALPLLPEAERFVDTALQATRGYVLEVFETLAAANPYPQQYFADAAFNQMVLKALFLGVPLAAVIGLEARITPELQRMTHDFVSERRHADRPVPADVALIL